MSKNIKYTTDGKKVVVIGDLNQTDKIVQEIFVTENGDEIPQGERFIEKNLLDAPMKSWKEKQLEKLEQEFNKVEKEWVEKINRIKNEKSNTYKSLYDRVNWLKGVAKTGNKEFERVINTIADFLSDAEKWVLIKEYGVWDLFLFNEDNCNAFIEKNEIEYRERKYRNMRLLSLFGESNGNLSFNISQYGDGSGSINDDVMFFRKKEEAIAFIQEQFDKKQHYTETDIQLSKKFNLNVCKDKLNAFKAENNAKIKEKIKKLQDEISSLKKKQYTD